MALIKEGRYAARVVSYGIPEVDQGKTPAVVLTFAFQEDGEHRELTWYGYLSEKAIDRTMKSLIIAGFNGDYLRNLCEPNAFEEKEVSIVVEHETYEGKTRAKIKWINEPGAGQFKSLHPEVVERQFGNLNSALRAARAELGRTRKAKAQTQEGPPPGRFPEGDAGFSPGEFDKEFSL